ncbi:MAG: hypothetical protein ACE5RI_01170 [Candidatus Nitrosomaritimum yanchengensis]
MKKTLFAILALLISSSLISSNFANAETEGVYVSKIITEYTKPGYVSAAILICAGNDLLRSPEFLVTSDNDSKTITLNGDVRENICRGETVSIKADDLSSITASLVSPTDPILIDDVSKISDRTYFQGVSVDGKAIVKVSSSIPMEGKSSTIEIEFLDPFSNFLKNVQYDISVLQDEKIILEQKNAKSFDGTGYHETSLLQTDYPLEVKVKLVSVGSNLIKTSWDDPQREIIEFKTVPEFGTVAGLVLVATISGVIFLSTRTKMSLFQ